MLAYVVVILNDGILFYKAFFNNFNYDTVKYEYYLEIFDNTNIML